MELMYRRCAGLDVHKKSISVCVRVRDKGKKDVEIQEAVFGAFTRDLERLREWLKAHKVKRVAMVSTGVYWIPVWNILEPVDWGIRNDAGESTDGAGVARRGRLSDHFRWQLKSYLAELDWADKRLAGLDERLTDEMAPHEDVVKRLRSIPGVNRLTAWILIAELGLDMSQFPSAAHAASWAGLLSRQCRKRWKAVLGQDAERQPVSAAGSVQNAWAARRKDCNLKAVFYRVAHRRR